MLNIKAQTPQALKGYYERHERLTPQIPEYCSPTLADLLYGLLKRNPAERMEFRMLKNLAIYKLLSFRRLL
jgi:hypothetical protein